MESKEEWIEATDVSPTSTDGRHLSAEKMDGSINKESQRNDGNQSLQKKSTDRTPTPTPDSRSSGE